MIFMKQYTTIKMQVQLLIFRDFRPFLIHHWIFLEAWHYFASYKKLQSVSSLFKVQVSLILFMFFFPSTSRDEILEEKKSVGEFYINQRPFPLLVFLKFKVLLSGWRVRRNFPFTTNEEILLGEIIFQYTFFEKQSW